MATKHPDDDPEFGKDIKRPVAPLAFGDPANPQVSSFRTQRCPECRAPVTPHCGGRDCRWLTCAERDCKLTFHPGRPEITVRLDPGESTPA